MDSERAEQKLPKSGIKIERDRAMFCFLHCLGPPFPIHFSSESLSLHQLPPVHFLDRAGMGWEGERMDV